MLRKILFSTAAAGAFAATGSVHAAPLFTIDDFTIGLTNGGANGACYAPCEIVANSGSTSVFDRSTGPTTSILGGDREIVLTWNSGGGSASAAIQAVGVGGQLGVYTHSNDSGVEGDSLLRWDGSGGGDTDGLDFGLSEDFSNSSLYVHISVVDADLGNSSVTLRLYDTGGDVSAQTVNLPDGASEHFLALSLFAGAANFDISSIGAIELFADGGSNFDAAIDIIEAVPEPLSTALFGLGLLGVGAMRRRKTA